MTDTLIPHTLESTLGILKSINVKIISNSYDKIRCSCPWGKVGNHYHSNENLSAPACDVTISNSPSGTTYPRYYCHSCGKSGDLEILPYEMLLWVRHNPEHFCSSSVQAIAARVLNYLTDYQMEGVAISYDSLNTLKVKEFKPYPEAWLASYPPALQNKHVSQYLYNRGLTDSTIVALDIRAFYYCQHYYACFPYRNIEGSLAGMRARCISPDSEYSDAANESRGWRLLKHRPIKPEDYDSNEGTVWYREDRLDLSKPVLIVEGQFDVAAILPHYDNVTCLFTYSASPSKLSFFNGSAGVIILLDSDKVGSTAHKKITKSRDTMGKYFSNQNTKYTQAYYPSVFKDAGELKSNELGIFVHKILLFFENSTF